MEKISVIGAGTMGSGIAQLAILHGHPTVLVDANQESLKRGVEQITKNLAREVEKGRKTENDIKAAMALLRSAVSISECASSEIVIEAIIESLTAKEELLTSLEQIVSSNCVLASNTSSLAIAALAGKCKNPARVVGIHFFNPAPIMKLVEIVPGLLTSDAITTKVTALVNNWGKVPVLAKDTPGFIVNRVARPYYGEALKIAEEGIPYANIDASMRAVGFKMGPFELMDLIGNDINYAVTCSVFESFYFDSRYRPSILQRRMVENNLLGRKTKQGYFDYSTEPTKSESAQVDPKISDRILSMLINEAVEAARLKIASPKDIESAMTLGVNYPQGLLSWCDQLGSATVLSRLEALRDLYGEERYRASPLLRQMARDNTSFFAK